MSLAPLLNAPAVVQLHAAGAFLAVGLGLTVLALRKGTRLHRSLGTAWALIMLLVALSSFAITTQGRYSAIHILSIITLVAVPRAVWARRQGNIRGHATGMILTFTGLLFAGLYAFGPGRIMHAAAFGG